MKRKPIAYVFIGKTHAYDWRVAVRKPMIPKKLINVQSLEMARAICSLIQEAFNAGMYEEFKETQKRARKMKERFGI